MTAILRVFGGLPRSVKFRLYFRKDAVLTCCPRPAFGRAAVLLGRGGGGARLRAGAGRRERRCGTSACAAAAGQAPQGHAAPRADGGLRHLPPAHARARARSPLRPPPALPHPRLRGEPARAAWCLRQQCKQGTDQPGRAGGRMDFFLPCVETPNLW